MQCSGADVKSPRAVVKDVRGGGRGFNAFDNNIFIDI